MTLRSSLKERLRASREKPAPKPVPSRKALAPKPEWNEYQHDASEFKLSRAELEAKREARQSKHVVDVRVLQKSWAPSPHRAVNDENAPNNGERLPEADLSKVARVLKRHAELTAPPKLKPSTLHVAPVEPPTPSRAGEANRLRGLLGPVRDSCKKETKRRPKKAANATDVPSGWGANPYVSDDEDSLEDDGEVPYFSVVDFDEEVRKFAQQRQSEQQDVQQSPYHASPVRPAAAAATRPVRLRAAEMDIVPVPDAAADAEGEQEQPAVHNSRPNKDEEAAESAMPSEGGEGLLHRDVTLMSKLAHASSVAAHEEASLLKKQLADVHARLAAAECDIASQASAFAHFKEIKEREVDLLKREFAQYKAHTSEVLTSLQTNMSKVTQWGWGTAAAAVPAVPAPSAPAAATPAAEEQEVEDEAMPRAALFVPAPNPPPVSPLTVGRVAETEHTVAEERAPRYTYTYTAAQQQQQQQTEVEDVEDVEEGELLDEETLPAFPGLFADRSAPAHGSLNAGPTARVPLPPLPNVSHLLSAALPTYAAVESGDGDDDECEERAPMTKHAWAPHAEALPIAGEIEHLIASVESSQPQPRALPSYIAQDRQGVASAAGPLPPPAAASAAFKEPTISAMPSSTSSLHFRQRVETGAFSVSGGVHRVTIPSTVTLAGEADSVSLARHSMVVS